MPDVRWWSCLLGNFFSYAKPSIWDKRGHPSWPLSFLHLLRQLIRLNRGITIVDASRCRRPARNEGRSNLVWIMCKIVNHEIPLMWSVGEGAKSVNPKATGGATWRSSYCFSLPTLWRTTGSPEARSTVLKSSFWKICTIASWLCRDAGDVRNLEKFR